MLLVYMACFLNKSSMMTQKSPNWNVVSYDNIGHSRSKEVLGQDLQAFPAFHHAEKSCYFPNESWHMISKFM